MNHFRLFRSQVVCFGAMLLIGMGVFASAETGWRGKIAGRMQGTVNGPGRFFCMDSQPMASTRAPATLVIGDGGRTGCCGVAFSLPRSTGRGKHDLAASTVFDLGKVIQVRVDTNGNKVDFFDRNPVGTLTIEAMPDGSAESAGQEVRGMYDVRVENLRRESIHASGSFNFSAPDKVSTDPRKQWYCRDPLQ